MCRSNRSTLQLEASDTLCAVAESVTKAHRCVPVLLTIYCVLTFSVTACGQSQTSSPEIEQWILEQGGEFDVDANLPGRPVVAVKLDRTRGIDLDFTPLCDCRMSVVSLNANERGLSAAEMHELCCVC